MADVFLSYSSKDRAAAQRVQEALTSRGIDVFWDQATPPGQDWDTWIRSKLANCKVAIVLWSRESVKSDNVRHEALVARKAKKLLPAMIDHIDAEDLPMGLYVVQATSLTDWRNADSEGMARLVAEVESRVGRRTPGAIQSPATATQPARKINWAGVAIGVVLVAGATGLTQWIYSPKPQPASPGLASLPCSNGLPRLNTGECPSFDPTRVLTAPSTGAALPGESFASKIVGRWHWEGQTCDEGTEVTMAGSQLSFVTGRSPPYLHRIESDTIRETRTTVVSPEGDAGQAYVLTPEYVATSDASNFNLVVEAGPDRNVWFPCPG